MSRISLAEDIRPLSEFRANAAKLIEQVRETRRPLVLTQRGRSTAVVLSVEEYEQAILARTEEQDIALLPIETHHLRTLRQLPLHHRDRFDRLILAQAIAEGIPVASRDAAFAGYDAEVIWG